MSRPFRIQHGPDDPEAWVGYDEALEKVLIDLDKERYFKPDSYTDPHGLFPHVKSIVDRHFAPMVSEKGLLGIAAWLTGGIAATMEGKGDEAIADAMIAGYTAARET
jgi:hypothetical protein